MSAVVAESADVLAALERVHDPDLGEPVTQLGFVASCHVTGRGDAEVHLRLPRHLCPPGLAQLLAADAYAVVSRLPGVRSTHISRDDSAGVSTSTGWVTALGPATVAELAELYTTFARKAVLANTDRLCHPLWQAGVVAEELVAMVLDDLPPSVERERLCVARTELHLPAGLWSPLLVNTVTGRVVGVHEVSEHLQRARLARVSEEVVAARHPWEVPGLRAAATGGAVVSGETHQERARRTCHGHHTTAAAERW